VAGPSSERAGAPSIFHLLFTRAARRRGEVMRGRTACRHLHCTMAADAQFPLAFWYNLPSLTELYAPCPNKPRPLTCRFLCCAGSKSSLECVLPHYRRVAVCPAGAHAPHTHRAGFALLALTLAF